jgi:hypothetical protein
VSVRLNPHRRLPPLRLVAVVVPPSSVDGTVFERDIARVVAVGDGERGVARHIGDLVVGIGIRYVVVGIGIGCALDSELIHFGHASMYIESQSL